MPPSRTGRAGRWSRWSRGLGRYRRASATRPWTSRRRRCGCYGRFLDRMAHGKGVALTPLHAELTTNQAAELLQVSRTHLVQLLDAGRIPCRKVGSHRRVRAEDIVAWRRETELRRREALDGLTARDQKLGLQ